MASHSCQWVLGAAAVASHITLCSVLLLRCNKRLFSQVHCSPQGCSLIHGLLKLLLRYAIRHQTSTSLDVHHPLLAVLGLRLALRRPPLVVVQRVISAAGDDHGPQPQGHVHRASEGDVADAAAIGAALVHLEVVNDLHRADLRCSTDSACRQCSTQRVPGVQLWQQLACDGGADVHHVAVALHLHQLLNHHAARHRHLAHIITPQVHQHDVLRAFFLISQQLPLQGNVLRGVGAAAPRAGQRAVCHDALVVDPGQDLGAAADDDAASRLHVDHVGGGVDHPQCAVHLKGVGEGAALKALTQHQLEDVTRPDVLLGLVNGTQELVLLHVALAR
mmetsp:Transcript_40429/g.89805  ORF Transcript_40429/g.89805 Transcript_40429/m.89805 type:complete len:333 (-) Transcript_40429:1080-2078(-)